jgi:hypothetical protein
MPARHLLDPAKRRRSGLAASVLAGLTLLGASPATAMPAPPDPVAASTAGAPDLSPSAVVRIPDRVDRQWPANPPWDACPRPVWPGERSTGLPGSGRRVLVIGDSLTRDSRVLSARLMRAAGWTPTFRCWGSRRLDWGLDQVARSRDLRQLPGYVIMALGTNDISWETPATTERRLRTLLDRLGPHRQVLWVDLHLTRSAWLDARADWFNGLLRRLERTHPNLTVVDWHRVARAHGIRGWDGIHYGPYGFRLRARTVAAALNDIGQRDPVASTAPPPSALPTPNAAPSAAPSPSPSPSPNSPSGGAAPSPSSLPSSAPVTSPSAF